MAPIEARRLESLAEGAVDPIVEIGTYHGLSTVVMARKTDEIIFTVDPHDMYDSWPAFCQTLAEHDLRNVVPLRRTSKQARRLLNLPLGGVYIDGDHSAQAVRDDLRLWVPLLTPGGFLALHDYESHAEGVKRALEEFLAEGRVEFEDIQVEGSLWSGYRA
ncbi:MAG: class I SAM-dependent methyltransferase [Gemmatimonadota bacterium]